MEIRQKRSRCRMAPSLWHQRNPGIGNSRKSPRTGDRSLLDVSLGCYPLRCSEPLAKTRGVCRSMALNGPHQLSTDCNSLKFKSTPRSNVCDFRQRFPVGSTPTPDTSNPGTRKQQANATGFWETRNWGRGTRVRRYIVGARAVNCIANIMLSSLAGFMCCKPYHPKV